MVAASLIKCSTYYHLDIKDMKTVRLVINFFKKTSIWFVFDLPKFHHLHALKGL